MPKIRAATVIEHRSMQRDALLDAARALLACGGMNALTFSALAERTGLARSSVYEYFRSRGAVVEELCRRDVPVWAREIESAMAAASGPAGRVEAFVRSQLTFVLDDRHRAVVAISAQELDAASRDEIRAAHGHLTEMVVEALTELGLVNPTLSASLLQGVVWAAMRRIEGMVDGDAGAVLEETVAIVLHGVDRDPTPP